MQASCSCMRHIMRPAVQTDSGTANSLCVLSQQLSYRETSFSHAAVPSNFQATMAHIPLPPFNPYANSSIAQ